jgi:NDP-sugar pyrophosphorylase family protein
MQVVILAGGLATRLGSLSQKTPKSMIRVHDKPFLEHQAVQNGFVTVYDPNKHFDSLLYIDEGLTVLRRKSLDLLPDTSPVSLGVLFERSVERRQLRAYETQQRFYEIGSLNGIRDLEALLRETIVSNKPEYLTGKRQIQ